MSIANPTSTQVSAISRLFSSTVIREMSRTGRSPLFARLLRECLPTGLFAPSDRVSLVFEKAFKILRKKPNRDEYVYKAALTHEVLLEKHCLQTASMLTEFRVGDCKADVVILNGTAAVYEIKSERDTLSRLERQIRAYRQVFAGVNVVAGKNHLAEIFRTVPIDVGIMELNDQFRIEPLRKSQERPELTNPLAIFGSLTMSEARQILERNKVPVPQVPNTELYSVLRSRFGNLDPCACHLGMVEVLKETRSLISLSDLVRKLPESLKPVALSTPLRKIDHDRLVGAVNTPLSEALAWT